MSKKITCFYGIVAWSLIFAFFGANLYAQSPENALENGDAAFDRQAFTEALDAYQSAFEAGSYTERSLYRLAFLNESLRNYPQAIFYLKKVQQDFGGDLLEEKVVQLMQKNGSSNYLTADFWPGYFRFFRKFGWIIWLAFVLSLLAIAARIVLPKEKLPSFSGAITAVAAPLFVVCLIALGHNLFLTPDRAVIVEDTAFYNFPSYGAAYKQGSLSPGETVDIVAQEDIWVQVEAGAKSFWIPKRTIRDL